MPTIALSPAEMRPTPTGAIGHLQSSQTLRKAVDALAIVPTRQRIFPLARKLYNVLLYIAQNQGIDRDTYRAPLFDIVSKAKFNSKDMKIVKNHLRAMNSTQVEWQSPAVGEGTRWDISNLIAHAAIEEPGSGKPVMIEWSFAPNIKQELLNPSRFAQISLVFQSTLRTHASIALFEICSRYMDNPTQVTARRPWEWWRPVLTGVPDIEVGAYTKYKYFKRDVLTPAVSEINRITDLEVSLIEHKEGRQIRELQFRVQQKERAQVASSPPPKFDLSAIRRATALGISQHAAESTLGRYGDDAFDAALVVLKQRLNAPKGQPISNLDRYVSGVARRIAREPKVVGKANSIEVQQAPRMGDALRPSRDQLEIEYRDRRRREARATFDGLDSVKKAAVVSQFEAEFVKSAAQVIRRSYQKGGLDQPAIRTEFNQWYAAKLWGASWSQASAEQLLEVFVSG